MNILKKVLSILLVLILFSSNMLSAYDKDYYSDNLYFEDNGEYNTYKEDIIKLKNWAKYIKQIDAFIENLSSRGDYNKLKLISIKIDKVLSEIDIKELTSKQRNTINLLKYFKYEIDKIDIEEEVLYEDSNYEKISEKDKKSIEEDILSLQNTLTKNINWYFEEYFDIFEKLSNYEEKWYLKLDVLVNHEKLWEFNWGLEISDYMIKASKFDSSIEWNIKLNADSKLIGEENFKADISLFTDLISKDWELYLLLKDLNIDFDKDNKMLLDIEKFLKSLESSDNKYIRFLNNDSKEILAYFNAFNSTIFTSKLEELSKKPFFEVIGKKDDKYILVPKKHLCDVIIENMSIYNPYIPKTCDENMYLEMKKEFSKNIVLYFIPWKSENQLWFYTPNKWEKAMWFVIYDDKSIKEININASQWEENLFQFVYEKDKKIYFIYNDYSLKFDLLIKNWEIKWNFNSYDTIIWKIDWTTDKNNNILTLNLNINSEFFYIFNIDFSYDLWKFNLSINWWNDLLILDFDWYYNLQNEVFDNFDFSYIIKWFDNPNSANFDFINSKLKLSNSKLSGKTSINNPYNKEKYLDINHTWVYKKNYLEFNNSFDFAINPFNFVDNEKDLSWNLNLIFDSQNNKNNINLHFDLIEDIENIVDFNFITNSIRNYFNQEIKKPENFIELEQN